MKPFIKRSFKTTAAYGAGAFLFTFFVIAPISMENNRNTWIAVYSFIFFVFTVIYLYKQMWKTGDIEKRAAGGGEVAITKGLLYGIAGFSPFILVEVLYFLIYPAVSGTIIGNVFHGIFRCSFGPMYFIIRLLRYTWYSYLVATLIIPAVAFAGYAAGIMGTGIKDLVGRRRSDEEDFLD